MLTNKPLVSIGIPIFNGMSTSLKNKINLHKSLQSILKQSYKNLEIIISDNCSNDETANIIKKYLKKDKRIIFYKQKKKLHTLENFRFVFQKSSGEYFKFNAHDDMISNNFIDQNIKFLIKNNDYAFSSSPFSFESNRKKKIVKIKSLDGDLYCRLKYFLKNAVYSQHCFYALFRKKFMEHTIFATRSNQLIVNKNIFCLDWLNTIQVLIQGKFKTIKYGKLIIGVNGQSNENDYIEKQINLASKNNLQILLRYIFPIIDFNLAFFIIVRRLKNISILKKLLLNIISLSHNWFFLKAIIKKNLFKIK